MEQRDKHWMDLAFAQATMAVGIARPNPAVGAVIVADEQLIATGCTEKPGSRHAEVVALATAQERARGATMYVTLEPCCHYGRTPPCTEAIIAAGIRKVCIAVLDPNPQVYGGGCKSLRDAGIEVVVGINAEQGREFYCGFSHWLHHKLPWVDVKIAQSLDGFIGGPACERMQISGAESSRWVHQFRAQMDYIAVGGGTVFCDDPELTVRGVAGNSPRRLVLNGSKALPLERKLFHQLRAGTEVYSQSPQPHLAAQVPVTLWEGDDFASAWLALLQRLGAQGVQRILLELGSSMAGQVLSDTRLWNRFYLFTAPKMLGAGVTWTHNLGAEWNKSLHLSKFELIGSDFLTVFENVHWNNTSSGRN